MYKYKTPYLDLGKQVRRVPDDSGGSLVGGGALGHDGPGGDDDAAVDGREGSVVLEVVTVAEGLVPLGRPCTYDLRKFFGLLSPNTPNKFISCQLLRYPSLYPL